MIPPSSKSFKVDVIVIARDHEATLAETLARLPRRQLRNVIVVDNDSHDRIARIAELGGAVVLREPQCGYGAACRRALMYLMSLPQPPEVAVFLNGDAVADAANVGTLIEPMKSGHFDLLIGSRSGGARLTAAEAGKLAAVNLIFALYGHRYTDLSPFRAIRYPALVALGMRDEDEGWLVEMQVKAITAGLRVAEVAVSPPAATPGRGGKLARAKQQVHAGAKILFTILRHATAR